MDGFFSTAATQEDPAVIVAREIGACDQLNQQWDARSSEAKRAKRHSREIYFDGEAKQELDKLYILRDLLSVTKATSLAGAAAQIWQALCVADLLVDQLPEGDVYRAAKAHLRTINRLLYSAMHVADGQAETKLAETLGADAIGWNCDPWRNVEDVVNRIEAEARADQPKAGA